MVSVTWRRPLGSGYNNNGFVYLRYSVRLIRVASLYRFGWEPAAVSESAVVHACCLGIEPTRRAGFSREDAKTGLSRKRSS